MLFNSIYHLMNFCEKKFDLDKMIFFGSLKTFKFASSLVHPSHHSVFPWFETSWDVGYGTRDFRLDSSRLFYLYKFNLVVHTKCWKGAFCMDYEAKFTVKQAR